MYPKGSPKYNMSQLSAKKKASPKIRKKSSPKGVKQRAQWNAMLEKSLVEILHEHNNPYHRGQNGWSAETWNAMVDIFHDRNKHVKFDKQQVHDKEKELKRDFRMLRDARTQSGVGWQESNFKLQAEPHLWDNLAISYGSKILKFQKKSFPLYDTLAELYHKHIAEGNYNFTSIAEQSLKPDVTDIESDDDVAEKDEDMRILDQSEVRQAQDNQRKSEVEQVQANKRKAEMEQVQVNQRKVAGPSTNKPKKPKNIPKKSSGDGLVGVMERFVKIKEKEANHEATQDFSITKCIAALRTLEGFEPTEKPRAFAVFKSVENREIFLSSVEDKDDSALTWLRLEMDKLK